MATKTTNYNFTKPGYDEDADIAVINANMDIIDAKMKEIENAGGSGGGGGASAWLDITGKPFESIGSGLSVNGGVLSVTGGGSSGSVIYSNDERLIGTWIDGSALYEKTLSGTITLDGKNSATLGYVTELLYDNILIRDIGIIMTSNGVIVNESFAKVYIVSNEITILQDFTSHTWSWEYNIVVRYTKSVQEERGVSYGIKRNCYNRAD